MIVKKEMSLTFGRIRFGSSEAPPVNSKVKAGSFLLARLFRTKFRSYFSSVANVRRRSLDILHILIGKLDSHKAWAFGNLKTESTLISRGISTYSLVNIDKFHAVNTRKMNQKLVYKLAADNVSRIFHENDLRIKQFGFFMIQAQAKRATEVHARMKLAIICLKTCFVNAKRCSFKRFVFIQRLSKFAANLKRHLFRRTLRNIAQTAKKHTKLMTFSERISRNLQCTLMKSLVQWKLHTQRVKRNDGATRNLVSILENARVIRFFWCFQGIKAAANGKSLVYQCGIIPLTSILRILVFTNLLRGLDAIKRFKTYSRKDQNTCKSSPNPDSFYLSLYKLNLLLEKQLLREKVHGFQSIQRARVKLQVLHSSQSMNFATPPRTISDYSVRKKPRQVHYLEPPESIHQYIDDAFHVGRSKEECTYKRRALHKHHCSLHHYH